MEYWKFELIDNISAKNEKSFINLYSVFFLLFIDCKIVNQAPE